MISNVFESGKPLVSLAAVFWMSRNVPPKQRGTLRDIQKTASRETSRPHDGGKGFSHWLSYNLRLLFKLARVALLLFHIICSVEGGCMKDSKISLNSRNLNLY